MLEKQSKTMIFLKRCFHFIVRVLAQKRSKKIVLAGSGCHLTSQFLHNFSLPFFCQIAHYLTFDWYRDGVTISRGFCFHSDSYIKCHLYLFIFEIEMKPIFSSKVAFFYKMKQKKSNGFHDRKWLHIIFRNQNNTDNCLW